MGVTEDLTAKNNDQTIDQTINALNASSKGLIFSNLVDFGACKAWDVRRHLGCEGHGEHQT